MAIDARHERGRPTGRHPVHGRLRSDPFAASVPLAGSGARARATSWAQSTLAATSATVSGARLTFSSMAKNAATSGVFH